MKSTEYKTLEILEILWRDRQHLLDSEGKTIQGRPLKGWCDIIILAKERGDINEAQKNHIQKYMYQWSLKLYRDDNEYWWPRNDYRRVNWMEDRIKELKKATEEERRKEENEKEDHQTNIRMMLSKMHNAGVTINDLQMLIDADFCEVLSILDEADAGLPTLMATIYENWEDFEVGDFWACVQDALDRRLK